MARLTLRNDQPSVRSAKQMVLDMVGRNLDDQLYRECLAAYTLMADNPGSTRAAARISTTRRIAAGTAANATKLSRFGDKNVGAPRTSRPSSSMR